MFKKTVNLGTAALVKKSGVKKFRDLLKVGILSDCRALLTLIGCIVQTTFPSLNEYGLNVLLPAKCELQTRRLTDSYTILYFVDALPMFIDLHGKSDLLPTGKLFGAHAGTHGF